MMAGGTRSETTLKYIISVPSRGNQPHDRDVSEDFKAELLDFGDGLAKRIEAAVRGNPAGVKCVR